MNRIDSLFRKLKKERRKAFIVYITAGYPSLDATEKLIGVLSENGADLIEIGIPFSDPLADGPTIQKSSHEALLKGASVKSIMRAVKKASAGRATPLVFMTYFNPVLHYGIERFVSDAKKSGVDGAIIPDLPPEEAKSVILRARKKDFSTIFLAAPTSTKKRLISIAASSTGFIYYVSLTGVTGARKRLPGDILFNVSRLKRITGKPVCVGFGVSTPEQARNVSGIADGVIVGSALIKIMEKSGNRKEMYKRIASFTRRMAKAVH